MFSNDTLTEYCADRGIEFSRSRAYRENDQAWVEQKNGAVIRRFLGHERYSGQVAGQTIAHLHGVMRRYVNYFQPSFKLVEKTRNGSVTTKRYSPPATPCDRVIRHEAVSAGTKAALSERRAALDPVALLHAIREAQSALAAIVSPELRPTPQGESLERFLARLPDRWREEQEHADRKPRARAPRSWRTRKDTSEAPLRRCVVRRAGLVAGRSGRQRSGIAGPAAKDGTGSIQPGAPAYFATEGAAVARHHGRQAGLCRVRSNVAGPRWNAGNSADDG